MKNLYEIGVTLLMTWHWYQIQTLRKQGDRLLQGGEPLSSAHLLQLADRMQHHHTALKRLDQAYEERLLQQY